jgi:sialate O-acetylesterase
MRLKGAIWYQGESNVGIASNLAYVCQFPAMIQDWRKKMNSDDFHFYFVQLAPFWSSDHVVLAEMRLAQMAALSLPYVGMGTAFDLGDANSTLGVIHPRNKQTVGQRLARAALNKSFGQSVSWMGPYAVASRCAASPEAHQAPALSHFVCCRFLADKSVIEITLKLEKQYGDKLVLVQPAPCPKEPFCAGFEYQLSNGAWVSVKGPTTIIDDVGVIVVPYNPKDTPVQLRYGFADWPLASVYTTSGLPLLPFMVTVHK